MKIEKEFLVFESTGRREYIGAAEPPYAPGKDGILIADIEGEEFRRRTKEALQYEERYELARYMIARWVDWAIGDLGNGSHDPAVRTHVAGKPLLRDEEASLRRNGCTNEAPRDVVERLLATLDAERMAFGIGYCTGCGGSGVVHGKDIDAYFECEDCHGTGRAWLPTPEEVHWDVGVAWSVFRGLLAEPKRPTLIRMYGTYPEGAQQRTASKLLGVEIPLTAVPFSAVQATARAARAEASRAQQGLASRVRHYARKIAAWAER